MIGADISKSTLSLWCRDIPLSRAERQSIQKAMISGSKRGRTRALVARAQQRTAYLHSIRERVRHLGRTIKNMDTAKIALSMLYLGEGSKWRSHRGLMLGSSDPDIILLYINLIGQCYGITRERLRCRISYRADQDINDLQKFWSKITCIPLASFYKTKPDPRTIGRETKRIDYKGVCVVSCGGTDVQLELEAIARVILRGR